MKKNNILFLLVGLMTLCGLNAQTNGSVRPKNIFQSLADSDSTHSGSVELIQDSRIEKLVTTKKGTVSFSASSVLNGYRVQVFSSNTQRTAKTEAFNIEKEIREAFPNDEVYVNYISPFWKVRVGDFISREKAEAFRAQIIEAFPAKKSETYVVREQINYTGSK